MSEAKFVVGQWVSWHERAYRVEQIDEAACGLRLNSGAVGAVPVWIPSYECFPFAWQAGLTYCTTIAGVEATIYRIVKDEELLADCKWRRDSMIAQSWHANTGKLWNYESDNDVPHLLPYLADEPKPVAEAATYSEFAEADECDDVNHPTHYTQHPSGVEAIAICEHFGFCVGNAIKYLWRAGLKGDALEDLKKAAWYVQREIERRERSGQ